MVIPVFVINLKRSEDRRNHTIKKLSDLNIPFQFIEAVDGTELSEDDLNDKKKIGIWECGLKSRYLFKEEIGAALSHIKIFQKIIDENIEMACILEDDNDYNIETASFLNKGQLDTVHWDLFYLGHHRLWRETDSINKKQILPFKYYAGEASEVPFGAYAYIITKEAAKKIMDIVYPIRMPFDYYIGNAVALGVRTYLLSPPCVFNNTSFDSTIQNRKITFKNEELENIREKLRKVYKLFPFLLPIRIWTFKHTNRDFIISRLRKMGILNKSYAKFD